MQREAGGVRLGLVCVAWCAVTACDAAAEREALPSMRGDAASASMPDSASSMDAQTRAHNDVPDTGAASNADAASKPNPTLPDASARDADPPPEADGGAARDPMREDAGSATHDTAGAAHSGAGSGGGSGAGAGGSGAGAGGLGGAGGHHGAAGSVAAAGSGGSPVPPVVDRSADWVFRGAPLGQTLVSHIAIAPDDEKLWFVGTSRNDGRGLLITRDAGLTWSHPATLDDGVISEVQIDPTDPNRVYADKSSLSDPSGTLYRSDDRGQTWIPLRSFYHGFAMHVSRKDGAIFVAAATSGTDDGMFRSDDHGATWTFSPFNVQYTPFSGLTPFDIEEDPSTDIMFVAGQTLMHDQTFPCHCPLLRSLDRGKTWADVSAGFGNRHWHATKVQIHPTTHVVYAQLEAAGLWRSNDAGSTWEYVTDNNNHLWDLLIDPKAPNRMFASSDTRSPGTLACVSTDSGSHFRALGPLMMSSAGNGIGGYLTLSPSGRTLFIAVYGLGIYSREVGANTCVESEPCQCSSSGAACVGSTEVTMSAQSVPPQGGEVDRLCNGQYVSSCANGSVGTFLALPQTGYNFDHWEGDLSGTQSALQVTLTTNKTATGCLRASPRPRQRWQVVCSRSNARDASNP